MNIALTGIVVAGKALLAMALNPLFYIGLIITLLVFRRQTMIERKLFYIRLHGMSGEFWRSLLWGTVAALAISLATAGFGLALTFDTLIWLWSATIVLMLIRVRYACIVYAAGVIALLKLGAEFLPSGMDMHGLEPVVESLISIDLPSLFALVALVHFAEALLIRLSGPRKSTPLYVGGTRGKVIGAYEMQGFWLLPLFLVVPATAGYDAFHMPWPLFFGGDVWSVGWMLLAFPVLIGYTEKTASATPEKKASRIAGGLLLLALIIGLLAVGAQLWSYAAIGAAVVSIVAHEWLIGFGERKEKRLRPIHVQDGSGLRVLAVQPGSPAADMGIVRGEVIVKANGVAVATKDELHTALRMNSAFCRLEVRNLEGHNKFAQRALYDGEHHQLGLVLCPDDDVVHYMEWRPMTLLSLFEVKRKGRRAAQVIAAAKETAATKEPK